MIQMAPPIGPLLMIACAAALVALAAWSAISAARRRPVRVPLRGAAVVVVAYAVLVLLGAATSRERPVPIGTTLCFDDWCAAVTGVQSRPGRAPSERIIVATLRISSVARRVVQRGSDPRVWFIDTEGVWHRAERRDDADPDVRSRIGPGESFRTALAAVVSARARIAKVRVWEGAWIDAIVPFDEASPFHGKTVYVRDGGATW